jgi:hypothetical protein
MSDFYLSFVNSETGEERHCCLTFDSSGEDFVKWARDEKIDMSEGKFLTNEKTIFGIAQKRDKDGFCIGGINHMATEEKGGLYLLRKQSLIKEKSSYLKFINPAKKEKLITLSVEDANQLRDWLWKHNIPLKPGRFYTNKHTARKMITRDNSGWWGVNCDTGQHYFFGKPIDIEDLYDE